MDSNAHQMLQNVTYGSIPGFAQLDQSSKDLVDIQASAATFTVIGIVANEDNAEWLEARHMQRGDFLMAAMMINAAKVGAARVIVQAGRPINQHMLDTIQAQIIDGAKQGIHSLCTQITNGNRHDGSTTHDNESASDTENNDTKDSYSQA